MPHNAQALVLHCIDFRFVKDTNQFLSSLGLSGQFDDVGLAGAVQNIVNPKNDSDKELVFRQIEISQRLHHINQAILINHTDCGAYGGKQAFDSAAIEREKHAADLNSAAQIIVERFPALSVIRVLARIDDSGKIDFEKLV